MKSFAASLLVLLSSHIFVVDGQNKFGLAPFDHTIELLWIQDFSSSYEDDLPALKEQFPDAIDELKWTFPHSKFGLAGFVDKPVGKFGYAESLDYCYNLRYKLTRYTNRLDQSLNQALIHSGRDWPEAQLHAMLAGALSPDTHWTKSKETPNGYKIHRVMVLLTDAGFHKAGDSDLPANNGDGEVNCLGEDYPSVEQVKKALEDQDIFPVFLVTDDVRPIYRNLVKDLGNRGLVASIDSKSNNLKKSLFSALKVALGPEESSPCEEENCECKNEGCCEDYDCEEEAGAAVLIHLEQIPKKLRLIVEN